MRWAQLTGRPWVTKATDLEAAADTLRYLPQTNKNSPLQLSEPLASIANEYVQNVAAMLVWQRCIRQELAALVDW